MAKTKMAGGVEDAAAPEGEGTTGPASLKFKALLDRVAARAGARKRDAKAVVEATLAELGEALSRGEPLSLPQFGRARVNRQKGGDGVETMVVKLRRTTARTVKAGDEPTDTPTDAPTDKAAG